MKSKKFKFAYALVPVVVMVVSAIIQVPIIDFVKAESSRYMLTNYKQSVREDILIGIESKVKSKLKESLKSEVIKELKDELLDEVTTTLKSDLTKEIRENRVWIEGKN